MTAFCLTLNAGSSSIKFAVYQIGDEASDPLPVASGLVERLGIGPLMKAKRADGSRICDEPIAKEADHASALGAVLDKLFDTLSGGTVTVVGHRIAHGGHEFPRPVVLTSHLLPQLYGFVPFAPSHQPHNLKGVEAAMAAFPNAVQVGVFDTAFHTGKAFVQDTYGLPRRLYDQGVRRYGHHGLSYQYIASALPSVDPKAAAGSVVVCHLGSGASMCAMKSGRSVESTMGFSALDGLPMGTRCGQLDPGILLYLLGEKGLSLQEVSDILYKESGLKGISELSNDMRDLETAGTPQAEEAIDYFCAMVRREIGAMSTTMGGLDAIVFCAGIGEHSATIRRRIIEPLVWYGLALDDAANNASVIKISANDSRVPVYVIPTDEEVVIARACQNCLHSDVVA